MKIPEIVDDEFVEVWPGSGTPEISILMPIFRQVQYIDEAIQSILDQRGVVAEIVISDDASGDETFDIACDTIRQKLASTGSDHKIVMRRGGERLWRDHLALMIDNAQCDIVCQAHGDDVAHPDRCKYIVHAFRNITNATMVVSEPCFINEEGHPVRENIPVTSNFEVLSYPWEIVIEGHRHLIGYCQAWRRSAVAHFPRLDRSRAAVAHDRILAFRARLSGEVVLLKAQLVKRRDHDLAAHHLMFEEPDTQGRFGWGVMELVQYQNMSMDLQQVFKEGRIEEPLYREMVKKISDQLSKKISKIVNAYKKQSLAGRQIAWVDEDTLLRIRKERNEEA